MVTLVRAKTFPLVFTSTWCVAITFITMTVSMRIISTYDIENTNIYIYMYSRIDILKHVMVTKSITYKYILKGGWKDKACRSFPIFGAWKR